MLCKFKDQVMNQIMTKKREKWKWDGMGMGWFGGDSDGTVGFT